MTAYVDTSVALRYLLSEPEKLSEWGSWEKAYTSVIHRVEFFRAMDRLRLEGNINDGERVELQKQFNIVWETLYRIPLSASILTRAAGSFTTVVGTLDSIHLASALSVITPSSPDIDNIFLTHDTQLAKAASAAGYGVLGVDFS